MLRAKSINIILVVAFIALLNVFLLWRLQLSYVNVFILCLSAIVIYMKPESLLLFFLIATSTVTDPRFFPKLMVANVDLYFTDLLLLFSFAYMIYMYPVKRISGRLKNPVSYALLLFVFSVIVAILVSTVGGDIRTITKSIALGRPLFYYLLFIPVVVLIKDEKTLMSFINALIILSIIVSIYIMLTAIFGKMFFHEWFKAAIEKKSIMAVDTGTEGSVLRQGRLRDIPGIMYVVIVFPFILGMLIYNWKSRSLKIYYIGLFLGFIVIIVNFTRTIWVSFFIMAMVMWFLIKGKGYRYVKVGLASASFVVLIAIAFTLLPKYSDAGIVSFIIKRFLSFFVENINTQTAVQRIVESKAALEAIQDNYLWGIGIANNLGMQKIIYEGNTYYLGSVMSVHNSYLNFVFKLGIFPLVFYLILSFLTLKRSYRLFKNTRLAYVKGLSVGIFLSYLRILINAFSQYYFWQIAAVPPIVLLFGLTEVLIRLDRKGMQQESTSRSIVRSRTAVVNRDATNFVP